MENSKSILIGLGGTGSRTINNVMKIRNEKKELITDGPISCVVFDTNVNDQELLQANNTQAALFQTSETQTVRQCMEKIIHKDPIEWCPYPEDFLRQMMTDGASEMRVKSRLALEGAFENNAKMSELESQLSEILDHSDKEVIRVVIVSSLSGGTGSGMFIQTALWIRKFFEKLNNYVTIRGVFLLPDIFVSNADNIKNNDNTIESHYANAYAAIRELNTIDRIITKGYKPERRIVIGDLFDSDNPPEFPVYDQCFFVDSANSNGGMLRGIKSYEKYVANLVYMQLYSPLAKELYSVEDNNRKVGAKSEVPLFGACGASRAVYPVESMVEYCALRATKDAMSTGWRKLDVEIEEMIEERKEKEREGVTLAKIDPRSMYVKLFDEKSNVPLEYAGSDKLFLNIKNDVLTSIDLYDEDTGEKLDEAEGQCKAEAFIEQITSMITEKITDDETLRSWHIKTSGTGKELWRSTEFGRIVQTNKRRYDAAKSAISKLHKDKTKVVPNTLNRFDKKLDTVVDEFERSVFPMDMGEISKSNPFSIYGLFVKKDDNGADVFVHPIAARYLLYKLIAKLKAARLDLKSNLATDRSKAERLAGTKFEWDDSLTTKEDETTFEELIENSYIIGGNKLKHLEEIASKCYAYHESQYKFIVNYERNAILLNLWEAILPRLCRLVEITEIFFNSLPDVSEDIEALLSNNCKEFSKNDLAREMPILGTAKYKEKKYNSLKIDVSEVNDDVNKEIVNAIYGKLCAERRPKLEGNAKYVDSNIADSFLGSVKEHFEKVLARDYSNKIYLNIYEAICEQSDYDYTGSKEDRAMKEIRYKNASNAIIKELKYKAAPSLIYKHETSGVLSNDAKKNDIIKQTSTGDKKVEKLQKELEFWGYNKSLIDKCGTFIGYLKSNEDISGQYGYKETELCCFSAVYGVNAVDVAKFDETNRNSEFYNAYAHVIEELIKRKAAAEAENAEDSRELALMQTPHIDKRWHEFLPYVSEAKQRIENEKFYRTFWLAIAYGWIELNDECYQLQRTLQADYFTEDKPTRPETLMYDGRPINKGEVGRLLYVLRNDSRFMTETMNDMEEMLKNDLSTTNKTYVKTKLYQGFVGTDINPIDLVSTYNKEKGRSGVTVVTLVTSLGDLIGQLVDNFDLERTDEEEEEKKFSLCRDIYNQAKLKNNVESRKEAFKLWLNKFDQYNLPCIDTAKSSRRKNSKDDTSEEKPAKKTTAKKATTKKTTTKKTTAKKTTAKSKKQTEETEE